MLQGVIRRRIDPEPVINSNCWPDYEGLVDIDIEMPIRVNHGANGIASAEYHVNRSESFWRSCIMKHMTNYIRVTMRIFLMQLKEADFRLNDRVIGFSS